MAWQWQWTTKTLDDDVENIQHKQGGGKEEKRGEGGCLILFKMKYLVIISYASRPRGETWKLFKLPIYFMHTTKNGYIGIGHYVAL